MSIIDQAKAIAEQRKASDAAQAAQEAEAHKARLDTLEKMKASVLEELRKLNGQETPHGTIHLDEAGDFRWDVFAFLRIGRHQVAWFKAKVVSGTVDYSDDCRDIPYTAPEVWGRFYPPNSKGDGSWDLEERQLYYNGGWTLHMGNIPTFCEEIAARLAVWL